MNQRTTSRESVSACLIVQNEQQRLPCALESVGFCDEVIVVDGGSTDRTVDIARDAGARVIENLWPGFAAQRNVALDAATSDWILEIDADERVSPQMRAGIEALLSVPIADASMAVFPLRNRFLGRPLGASAKYPAYRARLFRRGAYRHDESREVHEGIEPVQRPLVLAGDLEHELASTMREALLDVWRYARLESGHVATCTARTSLTGIILRPAAKWTYRTLVDQGWRDGWRGMLKITLDVISDALVWVLALTSRKDAADANAGSASHFGRRPVGSPKVVAVAGPGPHAEIAAGWLAGLHAKGIDVTLLCTGEDPDPNQAELPQEQRGSVVPRRTTRHIGPLAVMRALDVETQIRTVDAVVPVGIWARCMRHLVPGNLWPTIDGIHVGMDARQAADHISAALRRQR